MSSQFAIDEQVKIIRTYVSHNANAPEALLDELCDRWMACGGDVEYIEFFEVDWSGLAPKRRPWLVFTCDWKNARLTYHGTEIPEIKSQKRLAFEWKREFHVLEGETYEE
jgi:hypothetical protein